MRDHAVESWSINERCTPEGDVESEVYAIYHIDPSQPEYIMGQLTGRLTHERLAEKSHWVNRGALGQMIAHVPMRVHKLEQRHD